jgi:plasmid stabilization system protein ParE
VTEQPYFLTPAAEADLVEIAAWFSDRQAATRFLDAAYAAFGLIGRRPFVGHRRPDLTARDVLFWPLQRRYLIIYAVPEPPRILRVVSGWRDVASVLAARVP